MKTQYLLLVLIISFFIVPSRILVLEHNVSVDKSQSRKLLTVKDRNSYQTSKVLNDDDEDPSILRIGALNWLELSLNYDPLRYSTPGSIPFYSLIYDSLIDYDPITGELMPALATHWYVSNDSKQWTFILRNNVIFHDGSKFNATVVRYNYERLINPEHTAFVPFNERNPQFPNLPLTSINIDSEFQVTFYFNTSYAPFLYTESLHWILSPNSFDQPTGINPIGTGPYYLNPNTSNETFLNLTRFNSYYRGLAPFEQIYYNLKNNFDTEISRHSLDFFTIALEQLRNDDYYNVKDQDQVDSSVFFGDFNHDRPEVSKRLVRQAINYAIDRQKFIEFQHADWVILNLKPLRNLIPPGKLFPTNLSGYSYDVEYANQLLDDAGYPKGSDGYRFSLTLLQISKSYVLKSFFDDIGINLTIVDTAEDIITRFVEGDYDLVLIEETNLPDPHSLVFIALDSSNWRNSFSSGGFKNDSIDNLISLSIQTPIRQEREFYYDQLQRVVFDAAPVLSLAYGSFSYASTSIVKPYVFMNRVGRVFFNYSSYPNFNGHRSVQGTIQSNEAIYFPIVDAVLGNMNDRSLTVNITMDYHLSTFLPDQNIYGKFYRIDIDEQDLPYSFRTYYDLDEITGIPIDQLGLYQYHEEDYTWDELEILSSNSSFRYLEVQLIGEDNLIWLRKVSTTLSFIFVPYLAAIILSLAGATIYTIVKNVKLSKKFKEEMNL